MRKKSQVTIFIILGITILLVLLGTFVFYRYTMRNAVYEANVVNKPTKDLLESEDIVLTENVDIDSNNKETESDTNKDEVQPPEPVVEDEPIINLSEISSRPFESNKLMVCNDITIASIPYDYPAHLELRFGGEEDQRFGYLSTVRSCNKESNNPPQQLCSHEDVNCVYYNLSEYGDNDDDGILWNNCSNTNDENNGLYIRVGGFFGGYGYNPIDMYIECDDEFKTICLPNFDGEIGFVGPDMKWRKGIYVAEGGYTYYDKNLLELASDCS